MNNNNGFRLKINTDGIWRVNQMVEAFDAIDGLVTRVLVAAKVSDVCQEYNSLISDLQIFGLLDKGKEKRWNEAKDPADIITRSDFATFLSLLKNAGVDVRQKEFGLRLNFTVSDLRDIAPLSSRLEIERISMSSPGEWILLITSGILITKQGITLLTKIFDALFYHTKLRKAELKEKEIKIFRDFTVAIDSLIATLRNAGFENDQIKRIVYEIIMKNIDTIARFISMGTIKNILLEKIDIDDKD